MLNEWDILTHLGCTQILNSRNLMTYEYEKKKKKKKKKKKSLRKIGNGTYIYFIPRVGGWMHLFFFFRLGRGPAHFREQENLSNKTHLVNPARDLSAD